jgi:Flp pilus assembly protein TadG
MRGMLDAAIARLRRFAHDKRGAALVEFALILPAMLALYLGSIEASSLITVDRRVNIISSTVGDLVARWNPDAGAIPSSVLTDYFKASEGIIFPYAKSGLQQVVSVVSVAANGTTSVVWSCGYNGGTKRTAGAAYTLPANVNQLARGGWVVASETWYAHEPLLGVVLTDTYSLYHESFYMPRFEELINGPTC